VARKKEYIEEQVVEKAMQVFWANGYENTSMQMLEKEMGINKFSIYSSFGSKKGLFLESLKSYQERMQSIFEKLVTSNKGVEGIKEFFYDSVNACSKSDLQKGCMVTNTYNEFIDKEEQLINDQMAGFMKKLKSIFIDKLKMDKSKDMAIIKKQANFLLLAKHGLAAAARVNSKREIEDYIEVTFTNL